jgi:hypothetical protein
VSSSAVLNLQIAKAYLAGTDNGIATRTWQNAIETLAITKQAANQHRWRTAAKDKAFVALMPRIIIGQLGQLPATRGALLDTDGALDLQGVNT